MAERIKKQILDMKDDPDCLEDLYRSDPPIDFVCWELTGLFSFTLSLLRLLIPG